MYVAKYNSSGKLKSAITFVQTTNDSANIVGFNLDDQGNVYVAGIYKADQILNSFVSLGGGTITLSNSGTIASTNVDNLYFSKFNSMGKLVNISTMSAANLLIFSDNRGVLLNSAGNQYVIGKFDSSDLAIYTFSNLEGGINLIHTNTISNVGAGNALISRFGDGVTMTGYAKFYLKPSSDNVKTIIGESGYYDIDSSQLVIYNGQKIVSIKGSAGSTITLIPNRITCKAESWVVVSWVGDVVFNV